MSVWALIPAKDPAIGKSRLSGRLSPTARRRLSRFAFERVLRAVRETPEVAHCLVISQSSEILALAARLGATALPEVPHSEQSDLPAAVDSALNAAIAQGAAEAVRHGATALLVVAGDLPLADAPSLGELVRSLHGERGLAIAPDRHGTGTNVLFACPPDAIPFAFGGGSLERHRTLAEAAGLLVVLNRAPELTLDIDTPEDLDMLEGLVRVAARTTHSTYGAIAEMLDTLHGEIATPCAAGQGR
jgi:2-phospho-L-lactate guanylyltransferase